MMQLLVFVFAAVVSVQTQQLISEIITRKVEVKPHSIPFQAGLYIDDRFCGGVLISSTRVLTAAHCCDGAKSIEVVLGAHRIKEAEPTQVRVNTSDFTIHEDWDPKEIINDICNVNIPEVQLNENIATASLATDDNDDYEGQMATVSGWGRPTNSSAMSDVLRKAEMPVISNPNCRGYYSIIQDTNICAGAKLGGGACKGDGGGPLFIPPDKVIGILSFASGWGCDWEFPAAFTRVTKFVSWIESH